MSEDPLDVYGANRFDKTEASDKGKVDKSGSATWGMSNPKISYNTFRAGKYGLECPTCGCIHRHTGGSKALPKRPATKQVYKTRCAGCGYIFKWGRDPSKRKLDAHYRWDDSQSVFIPIDVTSTFIHPNNRCVFITSEGEARTFAVESLKLSVESDVRRIVENVGRRAEKAKRK